MIYSFLTSRTVAPAVALVAYTAFYLLRCRPSGAADPRYQVASWNFRSLIPAIPGSVGRPQHRYALAADAPSLGLEPSPFPMLATMLLEAAAAAGLDGSATAPQAGQAGQAPAAAGNEDLVRLRAGRLPHLLEKLDPRASLALDDIHIVE